GLHRLLAGFGGVVGDVPAAALQDEGGGGDEPADVPLAELAGGQRGRRDALPHLVGPAAGVTLVVVGRHRLPFDKQGSLRSLVSPRNSRNSHSLYTIRVGRLSRRRR